MILPPIIQLEAFLATPQQDESLEALRQEYETVLTLLETHFLEAIVSKEWGEFEEFVNYFKEQKMDNLESLLNPKEIEAFLKGKPVSDEFIAQLEEHTKALVEKLEVITKDLHRPGDDLLPKTQVNES